VVVKHVESVLVEGGTHVSLSHGQTDSVGETLTQRSSGDLDSVRHADLGVTRGDAVQLPERLQVVHLDLVTHQVEHDVLQSTSVSVGEDESVSVVPLRVGRRGLHDLGPEDVGDGGHSHRGTGVTRVGLGDDIGGKSSDLAARMRRFCGQYIRSDSL
jgi:hypothetical protein